MPFLIAKFRFQRIELTKKYFSEKAADGAISQDRLCLDSYIRVEQTKRRRIRNAASRSSRSGQFNTIRRSGPQGESQCHVNNKHSNSNSNGKPIRAGRASSAPIRLKTSCVCAARCKSST